MVEIHAGDESHIKRCRNIKFDIWRFHVNFNPVVTFCSAVIIWGLVIFCLVETEKAAAHLPTWTKWVTDKWTWLYIGTQDAWAVFILVLFFSKYSNLKLGKTDDEEPEFNDGSYFSMLFAAGIGVGLFYFGVAEPVQHYQPTKPGDPMIWGNRYQGRYSDNQRAQDAINVTLFHWGIHGWIVYTMIGLLLGFLSYRYNMPMTMRTCFYPLLAASVLGSDGRRLCHGLAVDGRIKGVECSPSSVCILWLAIAIFFPCWPMANAKHKIDGSNRWVTMVFLAVPFYGWVLLEIAEIAQQGLAYVGWSLVIGFVVLGGGIRGAIREKYKIVGNMAEDFFAVMLMYPLAAMQMEYQVTGNPEAKPRNDAEFGVNNYAMDKVEDKKEVEATRNPNKELDHYF
ncbi:predicted protein [Nematostella vectensis]|uniref:Uncharacterized protein n=1 Tax=Nematostella vectensis TaxID=45351 RepID=A7RKM8_NEMVE|nr:predicted protein [Nematostella vectensis]|eukprot:XP_001639998.1 predicted protein [Nematostella vectensis]